MKTLSLPKPTVLLLVGLSGSGKSYFGRKFAEMFQLPYVALEDIAPYARDAQSAQRLYIGQIRQLMTLGAPLVVDGPSLTRADRNRLRGYFREHGYETTIVWVQVSETMARDRAARRRSPSLYGRLDDAEYDAHVRRFTPPAAPEDFIAISGMHTYAAQTKALLGRLVSPRPEIRGREIKKSRPLQVGARGI